MNENRHLIRILMRTREDFQSMRKRIDNRLGQKKDGTLQEVDEREILSDMAIYLKENRDYLKLQEKSTETYIKNILKEIPVYNEFLLNVKGVGGAMAGWIISEFDIDIATTVSKMWQYAGLNPGLVYGKKRIEKKKSFSIVVTDELIRGDKLTPGFISPFNGKLRTVLCGILADSFLKSKSSYALDYYYPYKTRLEQEESVITGNSKGKKWKETSPGHRNNAAKRYMIKMFIKDLYVAWREIEGLPVRKPYAEEYLGKRHSAKPIEETKARELAIV